jgi:hypothetical protein
MGTEHRWIKRHVECEGYECQTSTTIDVFTGAATTLQAAFDVAAVLETRGWTTMVNNDGVLAWCPKTRWVQANG